MILELRLNFLLSHHMSANQVCALYLVGKIRIALGHISFDSLINIDLLNE